MPAAGYDGGTAERKPTGGRKRAAREAGGAAARSDTSSKQHAATLRYLAELDRENHKDVHIPVPTKRKEKAASKGTIDILNYSILTAICHGGRRRYFLRIFMKLSRAQKQNDV